MVGMATIVAPSVDVVASTVTLLLLLGGGGGGSLPPLAGALELATCMGPLGMESGRIKDSAISASSAYDSGSVGPQHGRLRNDKNGGAWCPRQMVSRDAKEYLEINLEELHVITGSRTQGRFGNGQGQEYAEEYMIEYWRPGFTKWVRWKNRLHKELLAGNTNTFTIVDQKLDPPIIATKFRFLPYSDHVRTVCMRVELVGCLWKDGLLSYDMPQGLHRGPELDLSDRIYDGREEAGHLSQGLGQLVDGQKGRDNFRLDLAGHGKGYEWVGWRNDTPGWAGHPLEILFEFDKVRNFSATHLHTNNLFTKDVQVFSHARAFVSLNGHTFNGEPVYFSYMPDLVLDHARNVTIKLHQRIGRFLKLQLYFASRWILLSEISFDSLVVTGNFTETEEDFQVPEVSPASSGRDDSLQRDEVKSTKFGSGFTGSMSSSKTTSNGAGSTKEEPKHYIGFVIGILTVVIVMLVAAIVFIVFRNQRLKTTGLSGIPPPPQDNTLLQFESEKMTIGSDLDKATLYLESSCHRGVGNGGGIGGGGPTANLYQLQTPTHHPHSPDYSEVPDLVSQEYMMPHHHHHLHHPEDATFLPKPPPVPPPPQSYYLPREIPPSPPLSPHRTKIHNHFLSPEEPSNEVVEEVVVEDFPWDRLRVIEELGDGHFGDDVQLCEVVDGVEGCRVVVVNTLREQSRKEEFLQEVRAVARLKNDNICRLLGGCLDGDKVFGVREYGEMGDLCQFLQDHVAETATPLATTASSLSYGCLIYMATQIASGMKYLEAVKYVHKDLASRNCLVGKNYEVKVGDLGSCRTLYNADYCQISGTKPLPLRWMAWESILLGKFSSKSDVWSFAVLLWEILTFAREQPFEELSDDKVIENVTHFYQNDGQHILLSPPINCPKEIFDLMCECWQRNESDRPNFREIHLFLQRKNLGYNPDLH